MTDKAAERIQKAIRRLTLANVLIYLAFAGGGYLIWHDAATKRDGLRAAQRDLRRDEANTAAALCSLRGDLEHRVTSTQDYLAKHQGATLFGVPRVTIVTNLNNQERTLRALDGLQCP